jgi:opacity protein-like surface antigen
VLASAAQVRAADDLPPEVGYNYGEIENPRTLALGGAQRALSYSLGGLFTNPANMATSSVYHLGGIAEIWPEADRFSYGGGAVDSIVNSKGLAGGIGGTVSRQDRDGIDRDYNDLRFALALPFQDKFFVGLGGRFLWLSQDGRGPLERSLASSGLAKERIVTGLSLDAGVTIRPAEGFSLAVVGNNLSDPGTGFQPLSAGAGLGYSVKQFGIEADVVFDFTTWERTTVRAMGGAELLVGESVPLRAGYRYDDGAESHAVSGGLGYVDRGFAADVAVRRTVSGDTATAVVLGFTVHLEATGLTPAPANAF